MQRLFEDKQQASCYANSRIETPSEVYAKIFAYLEQQKAPPHDLALDVGCGTGLSAGGLAGKFKRVIGIDVSESMIAEALARPHPDNVSFQLGQAEALPAEDDSVDLITSASASHYFDRDRFFAEAKRVLKPGGVVALFAYLFPTVSCPQQPESRITEEYDKTIQFFADQPTWPQTVADVMKYRYSNYVMPFPEWTRDDTVTIDQEWTIERLMAIYGSLPGVQGYIRENPDKGDVMKQLEETLVGSLSDPSKGIATPIRVSSRSFIVMSRKPLV